MRLSNQTRKPSAKSKAQSNIPSAKSKAQREIAITSRTRIRSTRSSPSYRCAGDSRQGGRTGRTSARCGRIRHNKQSTGRRRGTSNQLIDPMGGKGFEGEENSTAWGRTLGPPRIAMGRGEQCNTEMRRRSERGNEEADPEVSARDKQK